MKIHCGNTFKLPLFCTDGTGPLTISSAQMRLQDETGAAIPALTVAAQFVANIPHPTLPGVTGARWDLTLSPEQTTTLAAYSVVSIDVDVTDAAGDIWQAFGGTVPVSAFGGGAATGPDFVYLGPEGYVVVMQAGLHGGGGEGGSVTTEDIEDMSEAGRAIATADDAAAQLALLGGASQTALEAEVNIRAFDSAVLNSNLNVERNQRIAADADLQQQIDGKAPTAHTHTLANGATDVTVTAANLNTLDDGTNTTLHYHDADRARANHTGTQAWSTITGTPTTLSGYGITNGVTGVGVAGQIAAFDSTSNISGNSALRWLSGSLHFTASNTSNFITGSVGGNGLSLSVGGAREIDLSPRNATFGQWSGLAQTIKGPSAGSGNTNRAATWLNIQSGESTGSGTPAGLRLWYSPTGSSGTAENALVKGAELDGSGNFVCTNLLQAKTLSTNVFTVATLPSGTVAWRAFVSDETTGTFGGAAVGGGALQRPVFFGNGQWRIG